MAPRPFVDSIKEARERQNKLHVGTQDFLLGAHQILQSVFPPNEHPLNRYYRLRMNSQLDLDCDDVKAIQKAGARSTTCIKCGCCKNLRVKDRKEKNKSWTRRHCRRLRSKLIICCVKCQDKHQVNLKGRQSVLDQLGRSHRRTSNPSRSPRTHLPSPASKTTKGSGKKSQSPDKRYRGKQPVKPGPSTQSVKQIVKRKPKHPQTKAATPKPPAPQFSSRLRAFSCLLEP